MLISQLRAWYRQRRTLHVVLLEIFAVFVGITASLLVDDWRQRQNDIGQLNQLLDEIHFSLILDRASNKAESLLNRAALESSLVLTYGTSAQIDDDQLLRHLVHAGTPPPQLTMPPGYGRLIASGFTIPFDRTLASIDGDFRELESAIAALNDNSARIRDLIRSLQVALSRPIDVRRIALDGLSETESLQVTELFDLLRNDPGYARDLDDAATARAGLANPPVHGTIVELVSRRTDAGVRLIRANARINSIIATIRRHNPDITLPIESVGIDGSGTGLGWSAIDSIATESNTVPLTRSSSDPNTWSATIELVDGELKFRADKSWVINWGVPRLPRNLAGTGAQFEFGGDRDEYFPVGTAEIRGINIPVRAGRYRVVFNSQTFDYRFEPVTLQPPDR